MNKEEIVKLINEKMAKIINEIDISDELLREVTWISHEDACDQHFKYFSCRYCGKIDYEKKVHELDCPYFNFKKAKIRRILE